MQVTDYFKFLVEQIHTTVVATTDDDGLPVTAAIDIMDYDREGLYFLTAKGKDFYRRLKERKFMALTGIKGEDTMSCVALSVRGKVREEGGELLPRLISKNPYMNEIYKTEQSKRALTVFCLYEGRGEWFDLSKKPIERASFTFGKDGAAGNDGRKDTPPCGCEGKKTLPCEVRPATEEKIGEYYIADTCNGCKKCKAVCPQDSIDFSNVPAVIKRQNCLHCGNCFDVCPQGAVLRR